LFIQVWYNVCYMHRYKLSCRYNYIQNRLPEDKSSGSKHVEDIKELKIKILI